MLVAPPSSPYDLRFRLLDVPVRVSPWFWLVMLMLSRPDKGELTFALVFILCAFISILIHEFGHGLTGRATGSEPSEIVLYGMGGLCCYESSQQSQLARFLTIAAGPSAGFAFAAIVLAIGKFALGIEPVNVIAMFGIGPGDRFNVFQHSHSPIVIDAFINLIYINVLWGLINLLPVWPLDGGQMSEILLGWIDRRNASRWAHGISLLTAGGIAVWFASRIPPQWYPAPHVWFPRFHQLSAAPGDP